MKKLFITLALVLATAVSVFAAKETVKVKLFSNGTNVTDEECEQIRAKVLDVMNDMGRFTILDWNNDGATANVEIDGSVNSISYTYSEGKNDDGTTYKTYECQFNLTLNAVNLTSGETISTTSINGTINTGFGGFGGIVNAFKGETAYNKPTALKNTLGATQGKIKEWFEESFRANGQIIELDEVKKDEAKSFFISLGSDDGMVKGQKFSVKLKTIVAGRTRYKEIGEAKLEAVEGGDISLCKVKKGGKEIFKAFTETPDNLMVETKK